ncbi:MAG: hypothetical protein E4H18_01625 [Hyphomicrobiales bacterium]|nr:MAG: hypothetical protein E4H18_01625 [Hyphomicrobiales bacterium]
MLGMIAFFGELETLIADHLYPYRYVITPLLLLLAAAAGYVAMRAGVHRLVWRHRLVSAVVGVPLVIVSVVAGNYFASPLWERSFLEEASPLAAAPADRTGSTATSPLSSRPTHVGRFKGADDFHFGRGDALLIRTDAGQTVLRFENFSVRNGPDLYIYLSRDESGRRVEEALNLGRLKATDGAFNYEIPAGVDLTGVKSGVVWCRQFSALFAVAPLTAN